MAAPIKHRSPFVTPQYRIARDPTRTVYEGNQVMEVAMATFDPSGNTTHRTIAAHGLGVFIPDNAVITRVWIDVVTTFADGVSDAATIAMSIQAANDLVVAIAIADASNVWDAGIRGALVGTPILGAATAHDTALELMALEATSKLKMTAEREITATVAGVALTLGKANIFVEYFISD